MENMEKKLLYFFIGITLLCEKCYSTAQNSKEVYVIRYLEDKRIIPVTVQLDLDQQIEFVNGPSSKAVTLYDFVERKAAYKDINSSQCFISNLRRESLERDRNRLKKLNSGIVRGFYLPTFVIKEEIKNISELSGKVGYRVAHFCEGSSVSFITEDIQTFRRKRDVASDKNVERGQFTHHSYGHYGHQNNNYAHYGHETYMTGTADKDGIMQNQKLGQHQVISEGSQVYPAGSGNNLQANARDINARDAKTLTPASPEQSMSLAKKDTNFDPIRRGFGDRSTGQFSLETAQESGYQLNLPLGLRAGNAYRGGIRSHGQYGVGGIHPQVSTGFQKYPDGITSVSAFPTAHYPGLYHHGAPRWDSQVQQPTSVSSGYQHPAVLQTNHPDFRSSIIQPPASNIPQIHPIPSATGQKIPIALPHTGAFLPPVQKPEQQTRLTIPGTISVDQRGVPIGGQLITGSDLQKPYKLPGLDASVPGSFIPKRGGDLHAPDSTRDRIQIPETLGFPLQQTSFPRVHPATDSQGIPGALTGLPYEHRTVPVRPSFPFADSRQNLTGLGFAFVPSRPSTQVSQPVSVVRPGVSSMIPGSGQMQGIIPGTTTGEITPADVRHQLMPGRDRIPTSDYILPGTAGHILPGAPGYITPGSPGTRLLTTDIPRRVLPDTQIQVARGLPSSAVGGFVPSAPVSRKISTTGFIPEDRKFVPPTDAKETVSTGLISPPASYQTGTVPGSSAVLPGYSPYDQASGRRITFGERHEVGGTFLHGTEIPSGLDVGNSASSQTQVQTGFEGTAAEASSAGRYRGTGSQTQVQGGYTGNGSFSALAQSGFTGGVTQSQVRGGKQGGLSGSSAQVERVGSAQSQVQVGQPSGAATSNAQGRFFRGSTQVQAQSGKSGSSAGAQAQSSGLSSSQVQVNVGRGNAVEQNGFQGSVSASVHGGHTSGQSQTQLQGGYESGRTYVATAEGGFDAAAGFQGFPSGQVPSLSVQNGGWRPGTIEGTGTSELTYIRKTGAIPPEAPVGGSAMRNVHTSVPSNILYQSGRPGIPAPSVQQPTDAQLQVVPPSGILHHVPGTYPDQLSKQLPSFPSTTLERPSEPPYLLARPGVSSSLPSETSVTVGRPGTPKPATETLDHRIRYPLPESHMLTPPATYLDPLQTGVIQPQIAVPGNLTQGTFPRVIETHLPTHSSLPHSFLQTPGALTPDLTQPPMHVIGVLRPGYGPGLAAPVTLPAQIQPQYQQYYPGYQRPVLQPPLPAQPMYQPGIFQPSSVSQPIFQPGVVSQPGELGYRPDFVQPSQQVFQPGEPHSKWPSLLRPEQFPDQLYPSISQPSALRPLTSEDEMKPSAFRPGIRQPPVGQPAIQRPTSLVPGQPQTSRPKETGLPDGLQLPVTMRTSVAPSLHPTRPPGASEPHLTGEASCCEALRNLKRQCCDKLSKEQTGSSRSPCCSQKREKSPLDDFDFDEELRGKSEEPCKIVKAICYIVYKPVGKARICKPTNTNGC